ncbi:hypothetical protein ACFYWX_10710 [Streptomyces sp. NPDC002888]|uniref:hypothetical protein n=1 Tax=Streptomyces sp. NPDC002888 TaxID=3364668 RepID=UPI0036B14732
MSDEGDAICGATTPLPSEFIETELRVTKADWSGVTVTCNEEPHSDDRHAGALMRDGEYHGVHYWTSTPRPAS